MRLTPPPSGGALGLRYAPPTRLPPLAAAARSEARSLPPVRIRSATSHRSLHAANLHRCVRRGRLWWLLLLLL